MNIRLSTSLFFMLFLAVVGSMLQGAEQSRCDNCKMTMHVQVNGMQFPGHRAEGRDDVVHRVCCKCLIKQGAAAQDILVCTTCPIDGCNLPITPEQQEAIRIRSERLGQANQIMKDNLARGQHAANNGEEGRGIRESAWPTKTYVLSTCVKLASITGSFALFLSVCRQQRSSTVLSWWPLVATGAACVATITISLCGLPKKG